MTRQLTLIEPYRLSDKAINLVCVYRLKRFIAVTREFSGRFRGILDHTGQKLKEANASWTAEASGW
jgi:hypothetical protein